MRKKIFLFLIFFVCLFIAFQTIFAMEIDWPPSPMGTTLNDATTLTGLTKYLYEWGIALGGLAAFIALLIAGFLYLTSIGDPQKMADARGRIVMALFGLVLLLAAWIILNTINPDLTVLPQPDFSLSSIPDLLCDDRCAEHKDKTSCEGDVDLIGGNGNCGWNSLYSYCYDKSNPCKENTASSSCNADPDGCAWHEGREFCYNAVCSASRDKATCDSHWCDWDFTKNYCYEAECQAHADKTSCASDNANGCAWGQGDAYCYNKTSCSEGFVCAGDPNPGDGEKQGICTTPPQNQGPTCTAALVYNKIDWDPDGAMEFILPDNPSKYVGLPLSIEAIYDDKDLDALCYSHNANKTECEGVTSDDPVYASEPRPGRPCVWTDTFPVSDDYDFIGWLSGGNKLPNKCYRTCKGSACGCSVQLFGGAYIAGLTCGDMASIVPAYDRNFANDIEADPITKNPDLDCLKLQKPFSY